MGVWGCDGGKSFGAKSSLEGTIWACAIKSLDEVAGRAHPPPKLELLPRPCSRSVEQACTLPGSSSRRPPAEVSGGENGLGGAE